MPERLQMSKTGTGARAATAAFPQLQKAAGVQRCACQDAVQRAPAEAGFGHHFSQVRVQRDDMGDAVPLNGGGGGFTTVLPPTQSTTAFSGNSLKEVSDAMPPEPGALDFDIAVASNGDPITSATVTVSQVMTLPAWTELSQQCAPVKAEWNHFIGALRSHENGHVTRDQQGFAGAHTKYVGSAQSDTQTVTDALRAKVQATQDKFDTDTAHGTTGTPPTIIDTSIVCPAKTADAGPDVSPGDNGTQVASADTATAAADNAGGVASGDADQETA